MKNDIVFKPSLRASSALRTIALVGGGMLSAAAFPGMALAQTQPGTAAQAADDVDQAAVQAGEAPLTDDVIVVTGTRISNPNLIQSSPVNVVTETEIELRQASTAEELIGELPGISPGINNSVNNGSGGFASLNLRNLGTNRNLVLLNGQRIVPSALTAVTDLNVIPLAMIDRVDVLTGGASSVYGADAISGVANFITKRNFAGADLAASMGITEEGDGRRVRVDATVGANFDDGRGNVALSVGYQDIREVLQGNRTFSQDTLGVNGALVGSGTSTPTRITSRRIGATTNAVNQYDPNTGTLVTTYNTYNFAPFNFFQTPLERYNVYAQGHYEVADDIEVYSSGMFTKSTVSLRLAPSGLFGDTYQFPLNNPFINETIRQQICAATGVTVAQCTAAGQAASPTAAGYREVPVTINRRLVEMGPRDAEYVTNQFQTTFGVRGGITETIGFDIYGSYGESDRQRTYTGWGLKSRVQQALRATDANTCVTATNGCSPINLFGNGISISPEAVAFVDQPSFLTVKTNLSVVNGSINGDLGERGFLFADTPIGFVVGGEYRRLEAQQLPDVATGTQSEILGAGAPAPTYFGEFDVIEAFGEIIIPIIADVPGFYSLTAEGGVRVSDYSNTGTSTTFKAGGTYEPFAGFRLRGIYQRAVRSPNIAELFSPVTTGLTALTVDPCQLARPVGNAQLTNICISQGAPAGTIGSIPAPSAGQINQTSGGNPALDVEVAKSYTLGAVIAPPQVPGLAITADYYNIRITDAITQPTPGDILTPCFGPNNDGNGSNLAQCSQIGRNPLNGSLNGGGDTAGLFLQLTNQGTIETSGIDLRVSYGFDVGFGRLGLDFNGNWVDKLLFQASPTSVNRDCVGFYSNNCEPITPEFTWNLRTSLSLDDGIDLSLLYSWIDAVEIEPAGRPAGTLDEYASIDAYSTLDFTARFRATDVLTFTAGVYNLLDEDVPIVSSYVGGSSYNSGNTYPSTYDALGRRYQFTARVAF